MLVVDDHRPFREFLRTLLTGAGFVVLEADSGAAFWRVLRVADPDVILLDLDLPDANGHDILRKLRFDPDTRLIPIMMLSGTEVATEKLTAIREGATGFLKKPFDPEELLVRVRSLVRLKSFTDVLEDATRVILTLASSIDARDPYTAGHSERVSMYAEALGRTISLDPRDLGTLRLGGLLHDIGKVAVSDGVLLKDSALTAEERREVQTHPAKGARIVGHLRTFSRVFPIVLSHHERLDGSGYPEGLSGPAIPLLVRIASIADVFDALTTARPYRSSFSVEGAFNMLAEEAGKGWWDPTLVREFRRSLEELNLRSPGKLTGGRAVLSVSRSWPERLALLLASESEPLPGAEDLTLF